MVDRLGPYELNSLIHGDCLDVMPNIPDGSIDMILADLPYGTTACDWDSVIPLKPLWENYKRIIKPNGAIVLTASQPFTSVLVMSNLEWFKYEWIWDKDIAGAFALAEYRPMIVHENICVFGKDRITYNKIMTNAIPSNIRPINKGSSSSLATPVQSGIAKSKYNYNPKKRYPKSILSYSKYMNECNQLNRLHPTQKPVALFIYLIRTYSNPGDLILDNVVGSGTTAIAAIETGRNWFCIEQKREYYEAASERIEKRMKQPFLPGLVQNGKPEPEQLPLLEVDLD